MRSADSDALRRDNADRRRNQPRRHGNPNGTRKVEGERRARNRQTLFSREPPELFDRALDALPRRILARARRRLRCAARRTPVPHPRGRLGAVRRHRRRITAGFGSPAHLLGIVVDDTYRSVKHFQRPLAQLRTQGRIVEQVAVRFTKRRECRLRVDRRLVEVLAAGIAPAGCAPA